MNHSRPQSIRLGNKSRVLVLGGGPAGAFFAIHLLGKAREARLDIAVTIIDKKAVNHSGGQAIELEGCNYCAGIISPRLDKAMEQRDILVPRELKCNQFSHIWIHGQWKNFPLKLPPGQKMYGVFRGAGPVGGRGTAQGFDTFLLSHARNMGAKVIGAEASDIRLGPEGRPCVTVVDVSGRQSVLESDFLAIATGINFSRDERWKETDLFRSFEKINPSFIPPGVRRALILELKPGRGYLGKYMDKEVYFVISGSEKLRLDHISLVPKGNYLTAALVGDSIDKASFPKDTLRIIAEFLSLSQIRTILPHITLRNTPVSCTCTPFMVTAPARHAVCDRMAVVGDALGSRLYRDGLHCAFVGAEALAETVVHGGVDKKSLSAGYERFTGWLERDNRHGEWVMGWARAVLESPLASRILYQAFATEMKLKSREKWYLGRVLYNLGTCNEDYAGIRHELTSAPVLVSLLRGAVKTARNMLTEHFFGLSWENFDRYPTVIIKEKRGHFKKAMETSLNITLDPSPDMERMYAIKIRAPSRIIFEELGRFGEPGSGFLNLRFLDVKRIAGPPNRVDTVVRYSLKRFPVRMDIRLVRRIAQQSLLYEPDELFSRNGKLIFDLAPTKDGNNRLAIYTAFDFKRGRTFWERLFWKFFKELFPDFAHDVVWNHAICLIKKRAEDRAAAWGDENNPL